MLSPWYVTPAALAILAQGKPESGHYEKRYVRTTDRWAEYCGPGVDRLHGLYAAEFDRLNAIRPWPRDEVCAILETSVSEVLIAMFGDPEGYPIPSDRTGRREQIRGDIEAALAEKIAA